MMDTNLIQSGESGCVPPQRRRVRIIVLFHFLALMTWWFISPHGFPPGHAKWWTNEAIPLIGATACAAALVVSSRRRNRQWLTLTVLACGAGWFGAAITLAAVFPISGLLRSLPVLLGGIYMIWTAGKAAGTSEHFLCRAGCVLMGLTVGATWIVLQRSPEPVTHPTQFVLPIVPKNVSSGRVDQSIRLTDGVRLSPQEAEVVMRAGPLKLFVEPLLTFMSRSPDRFWTCFAPRVRRDSPPTVLTGFLRNEEELTLGYTSDYDSVLDISERAGVTEIDATSTLSAPIYSHLNSYSRVFISSFSKRNGILLVIRSSSCDAPASVR